MKTEIITNDFGIFECFSNDKHITKHIRSNQIFHPKLYSWIKNHTNGDVIDIGANIGAYSVIIASKFPQYKIHAVEAHPEIFEVLKNNKSLNILDNLIVYNFAAMDKESIFYTEALNDVADFNTGDMRVSKIKSDIPINGMRCDRVIEDGDNFSVIKIDAQGCDYEALVGCEKIIDKNRPAIIIEWEQHMVTSNVTIEDVYKYLDRFNYVIKDTYMRDFLFVNKDVQ